MILENIPELTVAVSMRRGKKSAAGRYSCVVAEKVSGNRRDSGE